MALINSLLSALDERTIAKEIGIPHDEARMRYRLDRNTVSDFEDFNAKIGEYYNYHFTQCISHGGSLSRAESSGRAKEILEREYRRRNGNIVTAYNDAHDGTNGGLRIILDIIAEGIKSEAVTRYIRDTFDRYVSPNSWDDKVKIIRQFIDHYGNSLSSSLDKDQPERYAQNFEELIRTYVEALQRSSAVFRKF